MVRLNRPVAGFELSAASVPVKEKFNPPVYGRLDDPLSVNGLKVSEHLDHFTYCRCIVTQKFLCGLTNSVKFSVVSAMRVLMSRMELSVWPTARARVCLSIVPSPYRPRNLDLASGSLASSFSSFESSEERTLVLPSFWMEASAACCNP